MKQKKLTLAIQAALLSFVVGHASAEPLTADSIEQLDATSIGDIAVTDVPSDLVDELINKLVSIDDLSNITPEVAQLLLEHGEVDSLSTTQQETLQNTVDTAVQAVIDGTTALADLPSVLLDELLAEVGQLTTLEDITDLVTALVEKILAGEVEVGDIPENLVSTLLETASATDTDLSTISGELATFLLENDLNDQLADKKDILNGVIDGAVLAILEGTTLVADIPESLTTDVLEAVGGMQDVSGISLELAFFLLEKDDATTSLLGTNADAIQDIVDTAVQAVLDGTTPVADIPAVLTDKVLEAVAELDDLSNISTELATFLVAHNTAEPPILDDQKVTALNEIINGGVVALTEDELKALTVDTIAEVPVEKITLLTPQTIVMIVPEALAGLTVVQVEALSVEALVALTPDQTKNLSAEVVGAVLQKIAGLDSLEDIPPEFASFLIASNDPPVLDPEKVQALETIINAGGSDEALTEDELKALTVDTIAEVPVEKIKWLKPETIILIVPEALAALTLDQAKALPIDAVSALSKDTFVLFPFQTIASLTPDQLAVIFPDGTVEICEAPVSTPTQDTTDPKETIKLSLADLGQYADKPGYRLGACPMPEDPDGDGGQDDVVPISLKDLLLIPFDKVSGMTEVELIALTDQLNFAEVMMLDLEALTAWLESLDENNPVQALAKIRFFATLDIKYLEKKFEKKLGKQYAKALEKFFKDLLPKGFKIHVKYTKEGKLEYKIKIKKHPLGFDGLKFVTVKFAPVLMVKPDVEEGETSADTVADLAKLPEGVLGALPDEEVMDIPLEMVVNASNAIKAKHVLSTIGVKLPKPETMPVGWVFVAGNKIKPVTADLTKDLLAHLKIEQVKQLDKSVMKELSPEQLGHMDGEALCQLPDDYLKEIPKESVEHLSETAMADIIFAVDPEKTKGKFLEKFRKPGWDVRFIDGKLRVGLAPTILNAISIEDMEERIAWLSPKTVAYFTKAQVWALTPVQLSALLPEQVIMLSLEAIEGFSKEQVSYLNYSTRLAFTLEQERATVVQLWPSSYPLPPTPEPDGDDDTGDDDTGDDDTGDDDTGDDDTGDDDTGDDDTGDDDTGDDDTKGDDDTLPDLGTGSAVDAEGNPVDTETKFEGGVLVDDEAKAEVSLEDKVSVLGEIEVDDEYVGRVAELVVFVALDEVNWYMLDVNGTPLFWEGGVSEVPAVDGLVAFKTEVELTPSQPVVMYEDKFPVIATYSIFFGFRLIEGEDAGTVIFNEAPMEVSVVEGDENQPEPTPEEPVATDEDL